jgi:hypothetical protein
MPTFLPMIPLIIINSKLSAVSYQHSAKNCYEWLPRSVKPQPLVTGKKLIADC